jgi:hypothetical protein
MKSHKGVLLKLHKSTPLLCNNLRHIMINFYQPDSNNPNATLQYIAVICPEVS